MTAPDTVRAFISLEIPAELKEAIGALQRNLMAAAGDVGWVKGAALHLTLRFLGPVPVEKISPLSEALGRMAAGRKRLMLTVGGVGAFPDLRRPRVIWVGLRDCDPLLRFQKEVEDSVGRLGFEAERRPFVPHLTIGRVRSPRNGDALARAMEANADWSAGSFVLSDFCLMKSDLHPGGAVHTRLWSITLSE
jgi:2'-5' RNA ligase